MRKTLLLITLSSLLVSPAKAAINWISSNGTNNAPPPTTVRLYSDSRYMACWEGTTISTSLRRAWFPQGSNLVQYTPLAHNTPGNTSVTKFCVFGDLKTDWGLAAYSTLRESKVLNKRVEVAADDAQTDNWLGWKLTEVTLY